jgi:hypothetical protein
VITIKATSNNSALWRTERQALFPNPIKILYFAQPQTTCISAYPASSS